MKSLPWFMLASAWVVALVATLGALFIGEVMGQAPCELCWYQRIAMFPLAWILGVATFRDTTEYEWYAVPLTLAGLAVATFHNLVYFGILPEAIHQCGAGPSCTDTSAMQLFGVVPIPLLSLLSFLTIIVLLVAVRRTTR